jgi:hypothetical protein
VTILIVGRPPPGLRIEARVLERVTREALEGAEIVAFTGDDFPADAQTVAAAGRLMIAPRAEPAYGFQPGVDHLAHSSPEELSELLEMVTLHPHVFEVIAAMGRLTAHARSASA